MAPKPDASVPPKSMHPIAVAIVYHNLAKSELADVRVEIQRGIELELKRDRRKAARFLRALPAYHGSELVHLPGDVDLGACRRPARYHRFHPYAQAPQAGAKRRLIGNDIAPTHVTISRRLGFNLSIVTPSMLSWSQRLKTDGNTIPDDQAKKFKISLPAGITRMCAPGSGSSCAEAQAINQKVDHPPPLRLVTAARRDREADRRE